MVELLIVLSIMAVLIGLLLPVLENVRKAARGAVCTSNLRQIDIGLKCYSGDYNGFLPPIQAKGSWPLHSWKYYGVGPYEKGGNSERFDDNPKKTLNKNIFICPETYVNRRKKSIFTPTAILVKKDKLEVAHAYGMNSGPAERIFGFQAEEFPINRVWIDKPSQSVLITESSHPRVSGQLFHDNRGIIAHKGGCNFLFYDGHVEWIHYNNIPVVEKTMFWLGAVPIP